MASNAEVVKRASELFDQRRPREWVELFTDDVEVPALALIGTESVYRGREGLMRWYRELEAAGTRVREFLDEFIEVDDRRVIVIGRVTVDDGDGRGYGSVAGWIYTVEGGQITHVEVHPHPALALAAAGLAPEQEAVES